MSEGMLMSCMCVDGKAMSGLKSVMWQGIWYIAFTARVILQEIGELEFDESTVMCCLRMMA
jgi:hypothetical protein